MTPEADECCTYAHDPAPFSLDVLIGPDAPR